jgi:ABC-2 type transport system permease protein
LRSIFAIYKRDLKETLSKPSLYVCLGVFLSLISYTYFWTIKSFAEASILAAVQPGSQMEQGLLNLHQRVFISHINILHFSVLFFIPLLTTRLFTEERKQRTLDLLLTAPASSLQISIAKMMASVTIPLVFVAVSFVFPATTGLFSSLQWPLLISAYIGLALMLSMYAALSAVASSMVESVLLAGFLSFMLILGSWFFSIASYFVDSEMLRTFLESTSSLLHYDYFLKGDIRLSSITFYLSIVALSVIITQRVVDSLRWR